MKYLYIDTETTGTDPERHGIIQLAGILEVDSEVVEEFDIKMCPPSSVVYDDGAMEVNGYTQEQVAEFQPYHMGYSGFLKILSKHINKFNRMDKAFFVGYNASFDSNFMYSLAGACGDTYFGSWVWWPPQCVAQMAQLQFADKRGQFRNFKLGTLASYLGIPYEPDKLHDALVDVRLTRAMFLKLMEMRRAQ